MELDIAMQLSTKSVSKDGVCKFCDKTLHERKEAWLSGPLHFFLHVWRMTEVPAAILNHDVGLEMAQEWHRKGYIPESIEARITTKLTTLGRFE